MYTYVLCEIFIPEKVKLSATPHQTAEEEAEIVQILQNHMYNDTVELLSFNLYYGMIENELYDEDNDNSPGTYFTISVEMLETLYKIYNLSETWQQHKPIILELIRREILFGDYGVPFQLMSEKEHEANIAIVKDYD